MDKQQSLSKVRELEDSGAYGDPGWPHPVQRQAVDCLSRPAQYMVRRVKPASAASGSTERVR